MAAQQNQSEENKRIVQRLRKEIMSEGNIDLIDEIFAEDVIDHTPLGEARGREAVKETTEAFRSAFPDLSVTVEHLIAEGDIVAARVTFRGTHEGELQGIEPTGEEVEFEVIGFLRLSDGRIVERWMRPDRLALMQQLGAVEPPGG